MAGYVQAAQVQAQTGQAQIVGLTPAAAKQLMANRIERSGTEITGITIVVPVGQVIWLSAKLPASTLQAFKQKLAALPQAERAAFSNLWLERVEEALYGEYMRVRSANSQQMFFSYPLPPLEVRAAGAATGTGGQFMPGIPKKTAAAPDTVPKAKTPRAETGTQTGFQTEEQLPPLPKGVTGKGTPKDPYVIDLSVKSRISGPGATQLVMPVFLDIGLGDSVWCKYRLSAVQLKALASQPMTGPLVQQLRDLTDAALENFCAKRREPYEGDVSFKAEDVLRRLGRNLVSFIEQIKQPELQKYFGK